MFNEPHYLTYIDSIKNFLLEDWGTQDWTTVSVPNHHVTALIIAKTDVVIAGLSVATKVFKTVDASLEVTVLVSDGDLVTNGSVVMRIKGYSHSILMAEITVLNIMQRLSGIASLTRAFVNQVKGTNTKISDTRKTTPGLKILEKYAVRCGGGCNHRFTLGDGVLIKENHILASGSISKAVQSARLAAPQLVRIEVEVENLDQFSQCLQIPQIDGVLLYNMTLELIQKAVCMRQASGKSLFLVASGNITLERARNIANLGIDYISIGAITHSAPDADISLLLT